MSSPYLLYRERLRGISINYPRDWQMNEGSLGGKYRIQFASPDNNAFLGIVIQRRQSSRKERLGELLHELEGYMTTDLNNLRQSDPNAAISQMPNTPQSFGGYSTGVTITYQSNDTIPRVEQRLYTLNDEFYYTFLYSANSQAYWQILLEILSTVELLVTRPRE